MTEAQDTVVLNSCQPSVSITMKKCPYKCSNFQFDDNSIKAHSTDMVLIQQFIELECINCSDNISYSRGWQNNISWDMNCSSVFTKNKGLHNILEDIRGAKRRAMTKT